MLAISRSEAKKLDEWAINEIGIPELLLMENAGRSVVQTVLKEAVSAKKICVVAGKGSNGGDGFVAARTFLSKGFDVEVFLLSRVVDVKGGAKTNLELAKKLGISVTELTDEKDIASLETFLETSDVVIDAMFGVGFEGELKGIFSTVADAINISGAKVFSIDIPSGIDSDSGSSGKVAVKADVTVTFTYPKKGMLTYPAIDNVGKLVVAEIGIPLINPLEPKRKGIKAGEGTKPKSSEEVIDSEIVAALIPKRKPSSHKGSCGEVLIIAGSRNMTGAAVMAARSALRVGAGLVKLGVPEGLEARISPDIPEVITVPLSSTKDFSLSAKALGQIVELSKSADCVAVGPGISTNPETVDLVKAILSSGIKKDIILDADALNSVADDPSLLKKSKSNLILTPHPGEMSRLTGMSVEEIQGKRREVAKSFAAEHQIVLVLKGAVSVIAGPDGRSILNITGNPGMATAGMGDVLTGAIAGLAAQGLNSYDSAISAVFIHGMAGDVVASIKGEHGIMATDLTESLPYVIKSIIMR